MNERPRDVLSLRQQGERLAQQAQERRDRDGDPWPPPLRAGQDPDAQCTTCGGTGTVRTWTGEVTHRHYLGKDPVSGEERYEMREDWKDRFCPACTFRTALVRRTPADVGLIYPRLESMTLETFRPAWAGVPAPGWAGVTAWVEMLPRALQYPDLERPGWLFRGKAGNGKTHAMVGLLNAARLAGNEVRFIREVDFAKKLHATYDRDSSESEARIIDTLTHVPLLGIDDIGKAYVPGHADPAQGNAWLASRLYAILDERLLAGKPTLLTTNLDDARLMRRLGEALMDRLDMLTLLEFTGESRR